MRERVNSRYIDVAMSEISDNTKRIAMSIIRRYEEFHGTTFDELVAQALDEQDQRVPEHKLSIYNHIMCFRQHLIEEGVIVGTIKLYESRIKTSYRKNRVTIPYLPPLNSKLCQQHEYITLSDLLTKEEITNAMSLMNDKMKARVMVMITGGLSNEECRVLTTRQFIDDLKQYHQKDNDLDALKYLADENNNHIWITNIVRQKTKKPYYAIMNPETVQMIARAKLKEYPDIKPQLLTNNKTYFGQKLREINKKLGYEKAGGMYRLRPHMLRKFHATYISGSVLNYEEHSLITNAEIDELQGRGKTSVQDTYMKVNPLRQKVLYAKVMNNVSLFHEYEYQIIDNDVVVNVVDHQSTNQKLEEEVKNLKKKIENSKKTSNKVDTLRNELGEDKFNELVLEILTGS